MMKNPLKLFGNTGSTSQRERIIYVNIDGIIPSPYQSREDFDNDQILKLGSSIAEHGLIQPLVVSVRKKGQYELIAGERRLRACKAIGLDTVPVIVKTASEEEKAAMTLVENLQRQNLHFMEEAMGYRQLIDGFDLTQEELARKMGKSQSTIANKLRILKLPATVIQRIRQNHTSSSFTERHARALLLLEEESQQLSVIEEILEQDLNVRQTETRVQEILESSTREKKKKGRSGQIIKVFKDIRLSLNSIKKTVTEIQEAGYPIEMEEVEHSSFIEVKIKLGKEGIEGGG